MENPEVASVAEFHVACVLFDLEGDEQVPILSDCLEKPHELIYFQTHSELIEPGSPQVAQLGILFINFHIISSRYASLKDLI